MKSSQTQNDDLRTAAYLMPWQPQRHCLQDMAHLMQDGSKTLCEETTAIGGPLHAHGWQMLLHHLKMIEQTALQETGSS